MATCKLRHEKPNKRIGYYQPRALNGDGVSEYLKRKFLSRNPMQSKP